ncbi:hypothetical protein BS47DRAFT_1357639 [Hydnum rufescens UP504]|uniref:Uncharacterized protein n=1 Tax=Hydnum rufescens UP504 TaxID=1448309 RepID=A0A9P6B9L4_9AGAM|nr:hypothetical protein BS47DRAFT_1357639 [Hydnum rufescens UP504]
MAPKEQQYPLDARNPTMRTPPRSKMNHRPVQHLQPNTNTPGSILNPRTKPQVPATYAMGGKAWYHTPTKVGVWYSKYHMPAAAGVWYYQGASLHSNPSNENTDDTLREYRRGPTRNTDVHSHLGKCYKIKPWNACEMKAPTVYACKVLVSCKNF